MNVFGGGGALGQEHRMRPLKSVQRFLVALISEFAARMRVAH